MRSREGVYLIAVLATLVALPSAARAQGPDPQGPDERIEAALDRALEAGIPVSLLQSKISEGTAKGVPMDRIAAAVEQRLEGLARAREVMGGVAEELDAAQLSLGADALGSGVSEAVLAEIAETAPGDQRAVAIAALTHLVAQGTVPETALLRVQEALARGPGGLANAPGFAGPPEGIGPPAGRPGGPPPSVPAPGQGGAPPDLPGAGGPPDAPGRGGGPPETPGGGGA
jgi:hypothetical protein